MKADVIAAYTRNVKRRRRHALPLPPEGFRYAVDEDGNYVRDENGDPVLEEIEE